MPSPRTLPRRKWTEPLFKVASQHSPVVTDYNPRKPIRLSGVSRTLTCVAFPELRSKLTLKILSVKTRMIKACLLGLYFDSHGTGIDDCHTICWCFKTVSRQCCLTEINIYKRRCNIFSILPIRRLCAFFNKVSKISNEIGLLIIKYKEFKDEMSTVSLYCTFDWEIRLI